MVSGTSLSGNLGDAPAGPDDAIAIVDLSRGMPCRVSYAELRRRTDAVVHGLRQRGLPQGARVGLVGLNTVDYLAAYFGVLRAGLVAVPINWRLPPATIAFILQDADAALVLADDGCRELCPPGVPAARLEDLAAPVAGQGSAVSAAVGGQELALILYTSGSTGRAKGVELSHGAYGWVLDIRTRGVDLSGDCFAVAAPLYHMNALNTVQLALRGGARVVLLPQFKAPDYLSAVAKYRATMLTMVPTMIGLMARETELLATLDLTSVKSVRLGSAPLSDAIIAASRRIFPNAAVANAYGTTEIGSVIFTAHADGRPTPPLALGYPHPAISLRLRDAKGIDADEGVLEVRTPAVMLGYRGLPEQTARCFTADGYYITNDVMRRDADGCFWFLGRSDDMFVCGGENVYPGEVEKLLERHPAVAEACVVPIADEVKGQKPFAFVVARPGAVADPADIKRYALAEGPAYAHPRAVEVLEAMPLLAAGKIDRAALRQRAELASAASR